jgi:hypothetical protein
MQRKTSDQFIASSQRIRSVPTESKDRQYTIHVGESSAPIEDRSNETVNQSKYGDGTTHCSTYCCIPSHMAVMGTRYAVRGVFSWTTNRDGAEIFYPNSEGIDVAEHELFFVCKLFKTMHVLHLDVLTYTKSRTRSALFDGQPDQLQRILGNDSNDLLYFTEDGGRDPGIHCRNEVGQVFTLVESPTNVTSLSLRSAPTGLLPIARPPTLTSPTSRRPTSAWMTTARSLTLQPSNRDRSSRCVSGSTAMSSPRISLLRTFSLLSFLSPTVPLPTPRPSRTVSPTP